MGYQLRDYQHSALKAARLALFESNRVAIIAPTGAGKTLLAGELATGFGRFGAKTLFLVDRIALIGQAVEKFEAHGLTVGTIWAKRTHRPEHEAVCVASVQTLRARIKDHATELGEFSFILIDECHCLHKQHLEILEALPMVPCIGLTATPSGKRFHETFPVKVVTTTTKALIASGDLVPFRCFGPAVPNLKGITVRKGIDGADWDQTELTAAMNQLQGDIIQNYRKYADGRPALLFAVGVEHSKQLAQAFNDEEIPAEHLDANTDPDERKEIFARFRNGDTRVLCSVGVLSIGFDEPCASAVLLCRPTLSEALHIQQCGRGARLSPGKADAIVLDFASNCRRHGLPQDYDPSIEPPPKRAAQEGDYVTGKCPECNALMPAGTLECPECGYERERPDPRELLQVGGELVPYETMVAETEAAELAAKAQARAQAEAKRLEEERQRQDEAADLARTPEYEYRMLLAFAGQRNLKQGWVFHKFNERHPGVSVGSDWHRREPLPMSPELHAWLNRGYEEWKRQEAKKDAFREVAGWARGNPELARRLFEGLYKLKPAPEWERLPPKEPSEDIAAECERYFRDSGLNRIARMTS